MSVFGVVGGDLVGFWPILVLGAIVGVLGDGGDGQGRVLVLGYVSEHQGTHQKRLRKCYKKCQKSEFGGVRTRPLPSERPYGVHFTTRPSRQSRGEL